MNSYQKIPLNTETNIDVGLKQLLFYYYIPGPSNYKL